MTTRRAALALLGAFAVLAAARANETDHDMPALRDSMARFAQPVRVGDLAHRYLIKATEAQNVLGYVAPTAIERDATGALFLIVDRGGLFGLGATRVAVPLEDVAVLGEYVALIGLTPEQLSALPRLDGNGLTTVPPDTSIRVAIVGPFH